MIEYVNIYSGLDGSKLSYVLNGYVMYDFYLDDASYVYEKAGDIPEMSLHFTIPQYVSIPLGSHVNYNGTPFYTFYEPTIEKVHSRSFKYTVTLYPTLYNLKQQLVSDPTMGYTNFSFCGTPSELCRVILDSSTPYSLGSDVPSYEVLMEFKYQYKFDALKSLAKTLHTDVSYNGDSVFIGDSTHSTGVKLSYGRGRGLLGDLKSDVSEKYSPLNRLYVQGTTRNMPFGRTLNLLDGSVYSIGDDIYKVQAGCLVVQGYNGIVSEKCIDLSGLYPHRIGFISGVSISQVPVDNVPTSCSNIVTDRSLAGGVLNYNDYLTDEDMTLMFQTGELYGHEFKVTNYDNATGTFTLQPTVVDDQVYLSGTFVPKVGDAYIIFHCDVPPIYIQNAQREMLKRASEYLYASRQQYLTFTAKVDPNWLAINSSVNFQVYDTVLFVDDDLCPDAVTLRIDAIKHKLLSYSDELTFGTIDRREVLLDTSMSIYEEIASLR